MKEPVVRRLLEQTAGMVRLVESQSVGMWAVVLKPIVRLLDFRVAVGMVVLMGWSFEI